jgi:succinate-semialdehyde dehydrogenase/glutarate-semialdehyde dehydrogenase
MYPDMQLPIDENSRTGGQPLSVRNPAILEVIDAGPRADEVDLWGAVESASRGFANWRHVSLFERSKIMPVAAFARRNFPVPQAGGRMSI